MIVSFDIKTAEFSIFETSSIQNEKVLCGKIITREEKN